MVQSFLLKMVGFLFLVHLALFSFAQNSVVRFERYSLTEGLSQSNVYSITQDKMGFMWFGTQDGLNRFDGYHFTIYKPIVGDDSSIPGKHIFSLLPDDSGDLWLGIHGSGLNRYNYELDNFTRIGGPSPRVLTIVPAEGDKLWIGGSSGLFLFDKKTFAFEEVHYNNDNLNVGVNALVYDSEKILWIGTGNAGLVRYDTKTGQSQRFRHSADNPKSILSDQVPELFIDNVGNLWAGTERGVCRLNINDYGAGFEYVPLGQEGREYTFAITQDADSNMWFGTGSGLFRMKRSLPGSKKYSFIHYKNDANSSHSLSANNLSSVFADRTGILWIGTIGGGVNKLNRDLEKFGHSQVSKDAGAQNTMSILEDREGWLWIGTYDGLFRWNRNGKEMGKDFFHYKHAPNKANGLTRDIITSLYQTMDGRIWIGTLGGGLHRWRKETNDFEVIQKDPNDDESLVSDYVLTLHEDRSRILWIGTSNGLGLYNPETKKSINFNFDPNKKNGLSNRVIFDIHESRDGHFWLGTGQGLNLFDPISSGFIHYMSDKTALNSLSENTVYCITSDPERSNVIWVGTSDGLNEVTLENGSAPRFRQFHVTDGLPNDVVYGLVSDLQGDLWLSTNFGLSRLDPKTYKFTNFNDLDGLQSNEFNSGSAFRSSNGEVFFGGIRGYNAFFPDMLSSPLAPQKVAITELLLFNQPIKVNETAENSPLKKGIYATDELVFDYTDYVFGFEFAALDYGSPSNNQYAYMLEGFDQDWIYTDAKRRFANYPKIPAGNYTFKVKAGNRDDIWNEEVATIEVYMKAPPWKTKTAYTMYTILIMGIVFLYIRSYKRKLAYERAVNAQLLEIQASLDRKVSERTKELSDKNEQLLETQQQLMVQAKQLEEQTIHLSALEQMKTRFFTNISHEFRTPLTLIIGPVEDLLKEKGDEKDQRQLTRILNNARRLLRLINQLLEVSKLEAGGIRLQARPDDLVFHVREWVNSFGSWSDRKKISLGFSSNVESLIVYFEADKLEKVIYNLIANALKFTPDGGRIHVTVNKENDDWVTLVVKDSGKGIPPEKLPYIFDRFYQVPGSSVSGVASTGIGLSLAQELVTLHGGDIAVTSEVDQGAEFTLKFPLGKEHLASDQIVTETKPIRVVSDSDIQTEVSEVEHDGETVRGPVNESDDDVILIVEDNPDVRGYIRDQLEDSFQVYEAENGRLGVEAALDKIPDLIISDVMMPEMDGFELCKALKDDERTCHIPIILLTARASIDSKLAGLETGADDYLVKPFQARELIIRMNNLIDTRKKLRSRYSQEIAAPAQQQAQLPTPTHVVEAPSMDEVFIQRAINILEENLEDCNFGVNELALEIGFSRRQLHRKFTALTGKGPADFIRKFRLDRAAAMLRQRTGNVSEIAYSVGFSNASYFSSLFRDAFGVKPSEYAGEE